LLFYASITTQDLFTLHERRQASTALVAGVCAALFGAVPGLRAAFGAAAHLPLYVTQLGGTPFIVGLVMASFAITSMLFRPLVGYWSDRWSRFGVMIAGLIVQGTSVGLCLFL
jgi:MFS family permease